MTFSPSKKTVLLLALGAAALLWRWLLPMALPFFLGALVALAAEPLVERFRRWGLGRGLAVGLGVSLVLSALVCILLGLTAGALRQLAGLGEKLPALVEGARQSLGDLQLTLESLCARAPGEVRPLLEKTVDSAFGSGSALLEGALARLPAAATALIAAVTESALAVGTGCLAAYMLSARLPSLRAWANTAVPDSWAGAVLPRLRRVRGALGGWLRAQGLLCLVCFGILLLGFWLLKVPYAPLWAAVIALVDAVPLLGTGTALVPWAVLCFLQGNRMRGLGLLGLFALAALARSALEPRLVGRQLGLDPLVTLGALYAGYRFWGFGGMLLAPLLCVVVKEVLRDGGGGENPAPAG